jgi:hypothetical protein
MIPLFTIGQALAHVPVIYITSPEEDWCAVINGTVGSDIVMLTPGVYTGPCDIVAKLSDQPGEQTVVESFDPLYPAVFAAGDADYVLHTSGESLLVMQVEFADLPAGVTAIRVGALREMWVRYSWFRDIAGDAVVQEGDVGVFSITDSEFVGVGNPIRIGCEDGSCSSPVFDVDENLIVGAAEGIRIGPGSAGTIRDNVIVSSGAGIRITGDTTSEIEINGGLYETTGPAIHIVRGPVLARANVAIGSPAVLASGADIAGVRLVGNTFVGALDLTGWGPGRDLALDSDAILGAIPDVGGADAAGNVACDDVPGACFVDAAAWDFYPAPGSPLRGAGIDDDEIGADWCGRVRETPPSAGAIDGFGDLSFGALTPTFKELVDCSLPSETPGTTPTTPGTTPTAPGTTPDTGEAPLVTEDPVPPPGCGCDGTAGGWGTLLWVPLIFRIRGRRSTPRTGRSGSRSP